MALSPGATLGGYLITALIGKGGMGEVWKARDTKLGREVAIKTLPEEFAQDEERLARFEREAKLLASLNHPHIAAIHGIDDHAGMRFLVLELVEGETLADRLKRGAIPPPEALRFAFQIAEALEAAHEKGVIHRDLKPANIKFTSEGKIKVLDFGLAKTLAAEKADFGLSNSPTLSMAATGQGIILGTAAYMSPEQAKGLPTDRRADIFAFGVVLFEMLTGRQAFRGELATEIMTSVINQDPDFTLLDRSLHSRVTALLRRCLEKDLRKRWQAIGDVRLEIGELLAAPEGLRSHADAPAVASSSKMWIAAIVVAVIATWFLAVFAGRNRADIVQESALNAGVVRFSFDPPPGTAFTHGDDLALAVSPDGRWIAFVAASGVDPKDRQLWLRAIDSEVMRPIAGTEEAAGPFWSADSQWIGFVAGGNLLKVPIAGGVPQVIRARATGALGGATWNSSDAIVMVGALRLTSLERVSAQNGAISPLIALDLSQAIGVGIRSPRFLKDGIHFIYMRVPGGIYAASLDGGEPSLLMTRSFAQRSSIDFTPGHILYVQDAGLYAVPFDEQQLKVTGEPVRLVDGVPASGPGIAPFSVSSNGVLAYWPTPPGDATTLRWYDRNGKATDATGSPARYSGWDLTPDGRRLVMARWDENGRRDIWIRDLASGVESKLTTDGDSMWPQWSPDGQRIAFGSAREDKAPNLYTRAVTGGKDDRITDIDIAVPTSWSADGKVIVFEANDPQTSNNLWYLRLEDRKPQKLPFNTAATEFGGRLSPDGQWLAYVTDESGRNEVWVARFPSAEQKWQISLSGGSQPEWRGDGEELFYISDRRQMMAIPLGKAATTLTIGKPEELFSIPEFFAYGGKDGYVPAPDGRRFLISVRAENPLDPPLHVILNWPKLVEKK